LDLLFIIVCPVPKILPEFFLKFIAAFDLTLVLHLSTVWAEERRERRPQQQQSQQTNQTKRTALPMPLPTMGTVRHAPGVTKTTAP
jgi:hypothetical protein